MDFGKRVQQCRTSMGLSQTELASNSGLSQSRISRVERSRSYANLDEVERIASVFGMTILELMDERVKVSYRLVKRGLHHK